MPKKLTNKWKSVKSTPKLTCLPTKLDTHSVGKVKTISRGIFKSILSYFNSNTPLAPWDFLQRGRVPNNSWLGTSSMCMLLLLRFLPKLWNLLNGILHRVVQEFNELFPKESSVSQEMWEERLLVVWKTNKVWGICLCLTVKFQLVISSLFNSQPQVNFSRIWK